MPPKSDTDRRDPGPQVKDRETYEALRDGGASKEKAARIANARADPRQSPSRRGGRFGRYEERTKDELYQRAQEIGIDGRSRMSKSDLISALRSR